MCIKKLRIGVIVSLFLLSGCVNKTYNTILRDINYDEIAALTPYGYELATNLPIYGDLDNDGQREGLLIFQEQGASERMESGEPMKIIIGEYEDGLWVGKGLMTMEGITLYSNYDLFVVDNKPLLFIQGSTYGVSDGERLLHILGYDGESIAAIESIGTTITNGGDILIKDNGKKIIKIDKIFDRDAGEGRGGCHHFDINTYLYDQGLYNTFSNIITSRKYTDSYIEDENNPGTYVEYYDQEENCVNVGRSTQGFGKRKMELILDDVGYIN